MKFLVFWIYNEKEISTTVENVESVSQDELGVSFLGNGFEVLAYFSNDALKSFIKE